MLKFSTSSEFSCLYEIHVSIQDSLFTINIQDLSIFPRDSFAPDGLSVKAA